MKHRASADDHVIPHAPVRQWGLVGHLRLSDPPGAYIGRKRCPNARLTFNGRCKPRTARL